MKRMIQMKTKKITAACLAVGFALVGTASMIAYAAGNPYENYKTAVVNTIGLVIINWTKNI